MKTIEKLRTVIEAVKHLNGGNGKAISELTGYTESDISRLGKAAIKAGFLEKPNGKYYVGPLCRIGE